MTQWLRVWMGLFTAILPLAAGADAPRRIVCLGDSITDGHTYPLLVQQALREAGEPVPCMIPAGIGGDTSAGMLARLDRDVFPFQPDLVLLSNGINDLRLPVDDYAANMRALVERLQARRIPVLLLTSSVLGPNPDEPVKLLEFCEVVRQLGRAQGCVVADVYPVMAAAVREGTAVHETDGAHLNFEGYRLLTRAVLDALGYPRVPVPEKQRLAVLPGIIREWHVRSQTNAAPLTAETEAALAVGADWRAYRLPEPDAIGSWWRDQERQRGVAMQLTKSVGPAARYVGVATLTTAQSREVFFNTGAGLQAIWLNHVRIYQNPGNTGWHPGKERIRVPLPAGDHRVVIESAGDFFLSVTEDICW